MIFAGTKPPAMILAVAGFVAAKHTNRLVLKIKGTIPMFQDLQS
jgi:hypothetical protein